MFELAAHAKINWDLQIPGRRTDGYHEIDTVMVSIGLADVLRFEEAPAFSFTCSDPSLPTDASNLVVKAALKLAAAANIAPHGKVHLEKRVPAGGGLGGGSSDGATTLCGLNQLWKLNFPREKLAQLAAELGSDVAFFLWGGWARCRGRGEIVEPLALNGVRSVRMALILPALQVSTPLAYKALGAPPWDGSSGLRSLTDIKQQVRETLGLESGFWSKLGWPRNDLMAAALQVEPRLLPLREQLERNYPGRWQMSGSGAVHLVLLKDGESASGVASQIQLPYGVRCVDTSTCSPQPAC